MGKEISSGDDRELQEVFEAQEDPRVRNQGEQRSKIMTRARREVATVDLVTLFFVRMWAALLPLFAQVFLHVTRIKNPSVPSPAEKEPDKKS